MGKKQKVVKNKEHIQLFVSGLPYTCTEDNLKQFFNTQSITEVKMPKYQDTGRSLGYAHVVFEDQEEYQKALLKNGEMMGNRYLDIKPAKGKNDDKKITKVTVPFGCKRLFVKNLPYTMVDEDVKNEFKTCGVIEDVRLVRNWSNKLFKGFAYIDYKDVGSVKKAIDRYHGKAYKGRILILDAVTSQQKKGFRRHDPNYNPNAEKRQEQEQ